ncbi:MAG TPA: methyltransferase [Pirellulaceae bacterium]|nr:methyltransferase [Pirellulaceae bacterium]
MPSIADQAIPGGWTERNVVVGHHAFRLILPADPDSLLEHLEDPQTTSVPHLADPYWAKLWPAAQHLAEALIARPFPPGTRVLELGCGSGLAGLAALAAGLDVTFSDYVPWAVQLALENAARNGYLSARGLAFDWRNPAEQAWPVIIAADVTYDRTNIDPLLETLHRMLAPGGIAWLGDAGRGPVADFVRDASAHGWSTRLLDKSGQERFMPVLGAFQLIVLERAPTANF